MRVEGHESEHLSFHTDAAPLPRYAPKTPKKIQPEGLRAVPLQKGTHSRYFYWELRGYARLLGHEAKSLRRPLRLNFKGSARGRGRRLRGFLRLSSPHPQASNFASGILSAFLEKKKRGGAQGMGRSAEGAPRAAVGRRGPWAAEGPAAPPAFFPERLRGS